ncbi:MAG: hypothetical protein IJT98_04230 [Prevotella sp.]|nr:hypothetical protein [Prevotella sp.]
MRTIYRILGLTSLLMCTAANMTAQELQSAYFTEDFKYRHQMNPALANDQGYFAIPVLGNINIKVQGNFGVNDILYKNPNPAGKKTITFMHPSISYDQAMSAFSDNGIKTIGNVRLTLLSLGFKAWGGYNTFEVNDRTMFGLSLPKSLMEFAKGIENKNYTFDDIGARAYNFAEVALGHSRNFGNQLRLGMKLKAYIGAARADLTLNNMHANLVGNTWTLEGQATGELNADGIVLKSKTKEYKSKNGTYQRVDDIDKDDFKPIGGVGLGIDLGAVYKVNSDFTVSAAINDLGFINWKNNILAQTPGGTFTFDGFHDIAVDNDFAGPNQKIDDQADSYADQLADFLNLEDKGNQGSKTTMMAATVNAAVEYKMPFYNRLSVGLLATHHFEGKNYSWTEGRLSANWTPCRWIDGGINVSAGTFGTGCGWILNIHPKAVNFFIGMDHIIAKTNEDMIPMSPNVNFSMGMNIAWGGGKKSQARQ